MSVRGTTNGVAASTSQPNSANSANRLNAILEVGMRQKRSSSSNSPGRKLPKSTHDTEYANKEDDDATHDTKYANKEDDDANLTLLTNDGYSYYVSTLLTTEMIFIKNMTEDTVSNKRVPNNLDNVDQPTMESILWFASMCEEKFPVPVTENDHQFKMFRAGLVDKLTQHYANHTAKDEKIFQLMLAANYLEYTPLFDACANAIAGIIKGMTTKDIQMRFSLKNNETLTPNDIKKNIEQGEKDNPFFNERPE